VAIRVISFDVGETLLRPYPGFGAIVVECCRAAGEQLPDECGAVLEVFAESHFLELRRSGLTFSTSEGRSRQFWTDLYRGFLINEGFDRPRADELTDRIYETFLDHRTYRMYDDALPSIAALHRRGFRLGITSNWESWLGGLLESVGLTSFLDWQIVSGNVGYEKPHRQIFDALITSSGVRPSEILHVGDSLASDIQGARDVGIEAVLLDRHDRHQEASVRRITTLMTLLDLPELAAAPSR
jgi:putative hydrolase of the HAD superfamily